ncbi:TonB-dependent receptor domain-containing protein [Pedobacter sp. MC2016-24]|uniref:TonB-dependent receptor domain-containing protein n=1 Tax=Pedobacter sp. MC2016-24 TaxID=2780090 RepID=UPI00187EEEF3|nr:TonB-dependent receptor [Pedobacter sp. MC2016-24]MBE9602592.1 TonB-dependent receptor [Pedobacter sp. MC2016-24]
MYTENGLLNFDGGANYLAFLQQKSTTKTDKLMASSHIGYKILENLIFETNLGFNRISLNGFSIYPRTSQNPANNPNNQAQYANNTSTTFDIEPQIDYHRNIGGGKLQALIGGTYQSTISKGDFIQGENYKDENLFGNMAGAGLLNTYLSTYSQYKYSSLFGRLNYNLQDKYILNISYRRDGSSRFGPGKQFGDFGAVGAAWLFSKESFTNSLFPFLSYGKLRASYGTVGNEPAGNYQYLQSYNLSFYGTYNGNTSTTPARLANPDFRWELNKKVEFGIETGFFKDRILLTTSWFRNRTANQLVNYSLPSQTGFTKYTYNLPAVVQNVGLEFSLNTINIKSSTFTWSTNFNLSFIQNKLISYPGLESSSYKDLYQVGESLSIKKGALFAGVDPKTGTLLFYSSTGEKILNPTSYKDRYQKIGKTMPDYFGALTNTLKTGSFELSFLIQFVKQEGYKPAFAPGELHSYMPQEALQRWQKEGDITDIPKASLLAGEAYINFKSSNYFWGDASYIKLKNLSLSYSLPSLWLTKARINQLRIYAQGQNLFTITKYKGTDPEIPGVGLYIPTLRVISLGLQLTL